MSTSEQKPSGFTVTDRRSFSASGEAKDEAETPTAAPPPTEAPPPPEAARTRALPPVDFGTFVLSLGSSAVMHMGERAAGEGGEAKKDLALAKHTIDILSMLQAKTKGNLTAQEDKLLETLLYELRLRYVEASKT